MSIRFFYLFFISLFMFSCQEKASNKEVLNKEEISREELTAEVLQLYYNDQKYRRMKNVFAQLNSECEGEKENSFASVNRYKSENDKTRLAYKLFWEDVTEPQDRKNLKKLIEITKKHGFPGTKRLGHDIPIYLVFVHTSQGYYEEVRNLIKKEYKAGRISKFGKDYIFWHLDGRNGIWPGPPHSINFRGGIEIFRGALCDGMSGLTKAYSDDKLLDLPVIEKNLSREELIAEVKDLYFNDQKYRRMLAVFEQVNNKCKGVEINPYNSEDDKTRLAYWLFRESIIEPQDRKNTKKLIALTKQYGFPGMERLGHDIPIYSVFVHTPYIFKYFDEVRKLVKQEYKAGRISELAKAHILWHVEGRMTGTPPHFPNSMNHMTDVEIFKEALKNDGN